MVKNWKKRWFVLQGNSLHYYKDKDVRVNAARASGFLERALTRCPISPSPPSFPRPTGQRARWHD